MAMPLHAGEVGFAAVIARLFRPLKLIRTTGAGRPEYKPKKRPIPVAGQR
jgi:hypothetical protein